MSRVTPAVAVRPGDDIRASDINRLAAQVADVERLARIQPGSGIRPGFGPWGQTLSLPAGVPGVELGRVVAVRPGPGDAPFDTIEYDIAAPTLARAETVAADRRVHPMRVALVGGLSPLFRPAPLLSPVIIYRVPCAFDECPDGAQFVVYAHALLEVPVGRACSG